MTAAYTYIGNYFEWSNGVGTKYYYAGSVRAAPYGGAPLRSATVRVGTVLDYLFSDHLGSTSITADSAGNLAGGMRYTAFGETRFTGGATPTSFRYTGQRQAEAGLYFYVSRYYDPALGRFTQADMMIPQNQGVQAWDRYAYVNNSPVNYNDPSGHCLVLCTAIIGGAVGAIVGAVGYTAYAVATGTEFNTGHLLLAASGGAAAGALIGTGVGIAAGMSTAAATTAAVTGAGTATAATETVLNATGGDPSDEISAASQAFGNLSQAADYGVQQGAQLKDAISGTGLKVQVHHIIEQRLAPALGQSAAQARNWLSTAVTRQEHQVFTNAWHDAIGYSNQELEWTTRNATPEKIWQAAQDIYKNYPALLDAARTTIFGE